MDRLILLLIAVIFLGSPLFSQETENFYDPDRLAEERY